MKPIHLASLLAAAIMFTSSEISLHAQTDNPPSQRATPAQIRRGGAPRLAPALGPIANVLTEEQQASLRQVMAAQRERTRGLEMQLRQARRDLLAATVSEKLDEQAVRAKAMAVGRVEAQMAVMRARALAQIRPPLSAEQKEKILNAIPAGRPAIGGRAEGRQRRSITNTNRDINDLPPKQ